ncbi:ubiquitin conjugating enzyme [Aspergillus sclerotialis]|uniref:Ubiquitin conjugating enzyme n=1 Tax=Aspergillus sclerotialis TaxID=2070753 RepID=A0A3A3A3T0_9EURO|nr:ubiquitin conjugating enzyme [Aspergillus sclerotialis]
MPRRDFQADLAEASVPGASPRISGIGPGVDYGSFLFTYTVPSSSNTVDIQATVSDASECPRNHAYFVCSTTDNIPQSISDTLESCQASFIGLSIQEFLTSISHCMDNAVLGLSSEEDEKLTDNESSDDEMAWDWNGNEKEPVHRPMAVEMMRSDLRIAKAAGFKVGCLGSLSGAVIVALSCRIEKLELSSDAMQAWDVRPTDYLVLLIRYPHGYFKLDEILNSSQSDLPLVQMRVGLCDFYKPSLRSATELFIDGQVQPTAGVGEGDPPLMRPMFLGASLKGLLNSRFISLVKHRFVYGFSWAGAEKFFNDNQGKTKDFTEAGDPAFYVSEN